MAALRIVLLSLALALPTAAWATDVTVMISGGFKSTYLAVAPAFEKETGSHLVTVPGPSMGKTPEAIPNRLARGEPDDVLVMVGYALDELIKKGEADASSKRDVALSPIGVAVRAGAPLPDVGTVDGLKRALLAAKTVAYSDSASGVYIEKTLFQKLGIEAEMKAKTKKIQGTPVAEIVARGDADFGFQEVAEILPVEGAAFAGRIPDEVQLITTFSAAVSKTSKEPELAKRLVDYLASPEIEATLKEKGLDPMKR